MPTPPDGVDDLIAGLYRGDARASEEFCQRYGAALERVAERHLPKGLRRRVDAEDVVQSVCRTFFRRTKEGQFRLAESQAVWALLCAITLTKVREQARFHLRQKRGLSREVSDGFSSTADAAAATPPADPGPTPDEAAEFADQFRHLMESFDEEERKIVELKLEDLTHKQIADRLDSSERTVRRVLKQLQTRLARQFDAGEG